MGWLGHAAWARAAPDVSSAPTPTSALRREVAMSVAIESALGSGPRALGDVGFGRAVGGHLVGCVGAADAHRPVALHRHPLHGAARRVVVVWGVMLERGGVT